MKANFLLIFLFVAAYFAQLYLIVREQKKLVGNGISSLSPSFYVVGEGIGAVAAMGVIALCSNLWILHCDFYCYTLLFCLFGFFSSFLRMYSREMKKEKGEVLRMFHVINFAVISFIYVLAFYRFCVTMR